MKHAEYIRCLIEARPTGDLLLPGELSEQLSRRAGCSKSAASNIVRQVLRAMEQDGRISHVLRGVYLKSGEGPADVQSPDALRKIAERLYIADGREGYYRGKCALARFGLDDTLGDNAVRIATNKCKGRQNSISKGLGVVIEKPTACVDEQSARYLQALDLIRDNVDALMDMSDEDFNRFFAQLKRDGVDYVVLTGYASRYGSVRALKAVARLCERLI